MLLLACLENAVRSYLMRSKFYSLHADSEIVLAELEAWFESSEESHPFAFRTICEAWNINPGRFWAELRLLKQRGVLLPTKGPRLAARNRRAIGLAVGGHQTREAS